MCSKKIVNKILGDKSRNNVVKDTVKLGVGSMVGGSVLGTVGSMTGTGNIANIGMTGLQLANIGNMAKIGTNLIHKRKRR